MTISPEEQAKRRHIAEQAAHNNRLEGQESSPEFKVNQELWVTGEISLEELQKRTFARYGIKHD
jgi:hypothetical protein